LPCPARAGQGRIGPRRAAAILAVLLAGPALAQDGGALFGQRCASCHAVAPGAPPMAGPNLAGLIGRRVGGDPGFDYSPSLVAAGRAGETWDRDRLVRFLEDPEEMYPGIWMGANGLRAEAERRAVAAFLQPAR
jgi:cytochrome c